MSVKEQHKKGTRAHAHPTNSHHEPAHERGRHESHESKEHEKKHPHHHRLATRADETEEQPRSKRQHSHSMPQVMVPRSEPEEVKASKTDQDEIEPSAEELQAEEETVKAAIGMVPRDEDVGTPAKERSGYDAD